jgi:DNA-nicking Smr family endonuclease
MGKRRTPSPGEPPQAPPQDDASLFRAAIGPVRELPAQAAPPRKPPPRALPRMAARDDAQALGEFRRALQADVLEAGDALSYRRDEIPPRVLQRLRRGLYAAQDELDLHHADTARAETMLRDFIKSSLHAGFGCIRIVHGKGMHSDRGVPVL